MKREFFLITTQIYVPCPRLWQSRIIRIASLGFKCPWIFKRNVISFSGGAENEEGKKKVVTVLQTKLRCCTLDPRNKMSLFPFPLVKVLCIAHSKAVYRVQSKVGPNHLSKQSETVYLQRSLFPRRILVAYCQITDGLFFVERIFWICNKKKYCKPCSRFGNISSPRLNFM